MNSELNHAVCELGRIQLALRRDLTFTPQSFSGQSFIVIEDALNSKFHRVGVREYAFLSLLDGNISISDALRITASATPGEALSEHEAAAICKWLIDTELAHTAESARPERLAGAAQEAAGRWLSRHWNPVSIQAPLVNPDRFFAAVTPWLAWLFSRGAGLAWGALALVAAYQAVIQWPRLESSLSNVFVAENWLWLGLCWLLLKVLHETAHGVVCKIYGGTIRMAGLMFVLLAPIAYVDVTSAWRFRSKWQRMHVAAAGIYVETFVAALALLVWSRQTPGVTSHVCLNLAVMASATTLLFNANPLMRFDGYYILSDLLELPNLYPSSQQWLAGWFRKNLLGLSAGAPTWPSRWGVFIRCYAWAVLIWRIVVCAGMIAAAATMFHGAGIVLAGCGIVSWIGIPAWRLIGQLFPGKSWQRPSWRRVSIVGGLVAGLVALLFIVPWPGARVAPAVVEYAPLVNVRAGASGFVKEVRVKDRQWVERDDVLAILENKELEFELADLQLALNQSELLRRANVSKQKLADSQAEEEKAAALVKRIAEKETQVAQLVVRASKGGQIVGRNLDQLVGTYLKEGDQLLMLGDESRKELQVSVEQNDLDAFAGRVGEIVHVRVPGGDELSAPLSKLEPRASFHPKQLSLCAFAGGPVAVRRAEDQKTGAQSGDRQLEEFEFLTPRFNGVVELTAEQSQTSHCGQLAYVSFRPGRESVGSHLFYEVARWFREKMRGPAYREAN